MKEALSYGPMTEISVIHDAEQYHKKDQRSFPSTTRPVIWYKASLIEFREASRNYQAKLQPPNNEEDSNEETAQFEWRMIKTVFCVQFHQHRALKLKRERESERKSIYLAVGTIKICKSYF